MLGFPWSGFFLWEYLAGLSGGGTGSTLDQVDAKGPGGREDCAVENEGLARDT